MLSAEHLTDIKTVSQSLRHSRHTYPCFSFPLLLIRSLCRQVNETRVYPRQGGEAMFNYLYYPIANRLYQQDPLGHPSTLTYSKQNVSYANHEILRPVSKLVVIDHLFDRLYCRAVHVYHSPLLFEQPLEFFRKNICLKVKFLIIAQSTSNSFGKFSGMCSGKDDLRDVG